MEKHKQVAIKIMKDEIQIKGFDIDNDLKDEYWEGHIKNKIITLQRVVPVSHLTKEEIEKW